MQCFHLESDRVALNVTDVGGQLDEVVFTIDNRRITPMHTAPWLNEPHGDDVPPMLRVLRGDFFCAPFGDSDVLPDEQRPHGATANGDWRVPADGGEASAERLTLELTQAVSGAHVTKRVLLKPGHAAVYQEHVFAGGSGRLPIGHHAMLRAGAPLNLSFSAWSAGYTPPAVFEPDPERGRSCLQYPQQFDDLSRVRRATGETVDVSTYPWDAGHEDLLMLVRKPEPHLAWTAAVCPDEQWVWFALKDARVLPSTLLWMSNGGRYYPPFSSRHAHALGLEEVASYFHLGHAASIGDNPLRAAGVPTSVELSPQRPLVVRYVFGLAPAPAAFRRVEQFHVKHDGVSLDDGDGREIFAALDPEWVTAGTSGRES